MTTSTTLKTWDGVPLTEGLVVWTNEFRVGRVTFKRHRVSDDGWFDVEYPEGRTVMQNSERVATVFEGVKAVDRLRETEQQLRDAGLGDDKED